LCLLIHQHDATPTICTFNLTILDTLRGLYKAREYNFFDFENFDLPEYEHYEQVENGDLNWCMDGKFIAFAGPHATRESSPGGYHSLCPDDYVPYFLRKNVSLVVRLNKKYYDAKRFTNHGINHIDLYFIDGSNPPDHILRQFLQVSEETRGGIAVHCKAGLGRTGSLIGCYMMKHFKMTAEETIGWLRIVRPGSIIGPQQQYMKDMQPRMWREGQLQREKFASIKTVGVGMPGDSNGRLYRAGASQKSDGALGSDRDEEKERAGDSQGDHLRLRRQQMKDDMKVSAGGGGGVKQPGGSAEIVARPSASSYSIGNLLGSWK
jgi:protein-tyrosine phosphatase